MNGHAGYKVLYMKLAQKKMKTTHLPHGKIGRYDNPNQLYLHSEHHLTFSLLKYDIFFVVIVVVLFLSLLFQW